MFGRARRCFGLGCLHLAIVLIHRARNCSGKHHASERPLRNEAPVPSLLHLRFTRTAHRRVAPRVYTRFEISQRLAQFRLNCLRVLCIGGPKIFAVHCLSPNSFRTLARARERCAFTVPSPMPVDSAICFSSSSSTNLRRNTVRCRSLRLSTACQTRATCSFASMRCSADRSPLGSHSLASSRSTEFVRVWRQNCNRRFRQWSFCRLIAIRINHVNALESPRKLDQLLCAFRKQSCVSVSARSTSRVEASRKRNICGRWLTTTLSNSCAAISSAETLIIGCNAVQAAITLVDAPIEPEFTANLPFPDFLLITSETDGPSRKPRGNREQGAGNRE